MRAIKIDSKNRTITEININNLDDMQQVVEDWICTGFNFPDDQNTCYVNDEGLLESPEHFFVHKDGHQPFAGNGLIIGFNPYTGENEACTLNLEEVKDDVQFLTLWQVQLLVRHGIVDYNAYMTTEDGTEKIATVDLGAFDEH